MPIYAFKCHKHGSFDVWQKMNDEHKAYCPKCGKAGDRVFSPLPLHGMMPPIGRTRTELFDNLAKEGMAHKNWREADGTGQEECLSGR